MREKEFLLREFFLAKTSVDYDYTSIKISKQGPKQQNIGQQNTNRIMSNAAQK